MNTAVMHPGERKAQFLWTAFILMFFLIQATIWTVAISITSGDRSHSVVAGYDEQALRWDEVKAMRQASKELKWDCQLTVDPELDPLGIQAVTIRLTDREGVALSGAVVKIDAFHRGNAADVQRLSFVETDPGVYRSPILIDKFGQWRFSGTAARGENKMLIELDAVQERTSATETKTAPLEN